MESILFSSAGRRNQLIDCFRQSAAALDTPLRVLAADLRPELSSACQAADAAIKVPRCTSNEFVPALLDVCRVEGVGLLIPTIDTELPVLAANREKFAAIGTRVAISGPDVISIARDKLRTMEVFAAAGVSVPRTGRLSDVLQSGDWKWPLLLKPRAGSSSVGVRIVKSAAEAALASKERDDYLAQELWRGREFTVNLFFDQSGSLRCAVPHWRIETRGGEVSKGRTERVPALMEAAETIARALPDARGALCFQAIVTEDGRIAVFELNARFGGGYPLAHHAGATFAQWLLEECAGRSSAATNEWREGVTMLRYDSAVFNEP